MTPDLFDREAFAEKFSKLLDVMPPEQVLESFTRRGDSIVPPTPDELARQRRDLGIGRAADGATREWLDRALEYVRQHAVVHATMLAEDVRARAEADGLPQSGDPRVWGHVMRRAAREGIIVQDGYAPANSSNRSPKVSWRSLVIA